MALAHDVGRMHAPTLRHGMHVFPAILRSGWPTGAL